MPHREYPPLGSVSSGTMRPEDLIPAFLDVLEEYNEAEYTRLTDDNQPLFDYYERSDPDAEYHNPRHPAETIEDVESFLTETLFDRLGEIAAPYTYFGAHEGDGADYGFWPSHDQIEEECRSGELAEITPDNTIVAGRPAEPLPHYAIEINERENMTLYELIIERRELWSIV